MGKPTPTANGEAVQLAWVMNSFFYNEAVAIFFSFVVLPLVMTGAQNSATEGAWEVLSA